ncbi:hypothetical protein SLE2022_040150 [Rubroshorea leprosula]
MHVGWLACIFQNAHISTLESSKIPGLSRFDLVGTLSCIAYQLNATSGYQIRLKMLLPLLAWLDGSIAYPDLIEVNLHLNASISVCPPILALAAPHPVSNLALPQFNWTLFPGEKGSEIQYLRNVSSIHLLAPSRQVAQLEIQNCIGSSIQNLILSPGFKLFWASPNRVCPKWYGPIWK